MEKNKLYVSNMSFDTKEEDIKGVFEEFGEITDLKMITDRETGKFRGFCFITYADEESAANAKDNATGKEINGREISIDFARPMQKRTFQKRDYRN